MEYIAQTWASQCTWGHDQCRDVGEEISISQYKEKHIIVVYVIINYLFAHVIKYAILWISERFPVGQNIANVGTSGNIDNFHFYDLVYNWYYEVKQFSKNDVSSFRYNCYMFCSDFHHRTITIFTDFLNYIMLKIY